MQSSFKLASLSQASAKVPPRGQIGVRHFAHFTMRNHPVLTQHDRKRQTTTEIAQAFTQFQTCKTRQYNRERHGRTAQKTLHRILLIDGDTEYLPAVR